MKTYGDPSRLWQQFVRGDRSAFSAIYDTYMDGLFEYGMRILRDEDQVKDCLHDLFTKLWSNRKSLAETDNIRFYLLRSLRNTIISYKTREDRFPKAEVQEEDIFLLEFDPEHIQINKEQVDEQADRIKSAMGQLTARQKEIIYLRYFEELSYDEISELMHLTVKGAYKLSARALEALRLILGSSEALLVFILLNYKSKIF